DDGEDLAVSVVPHAREGDEGDVGRVEHELEAEQHDERVAAREHAGGADREDQRADHQVPVEAHQPPSASDRPARAGSPPPGPSSSGSRELCPPTASAIVPTPGGSLKSMTATRSASSA